MIGKDETERFKRYCKEQDELGAMKEAQFIEQMKECIAELEAKLDTAYAVAEAYVEQVDELEAKLERVRKCQQYSLEGTILVRRYDLVRNSSNEVLGEVMLTADVLAALGDKDRCKKEAGTHFRAIPYDPMSRTRCQQFLQSTPFVINTSPPERVFYCPRCGEWSSEPIEDWAGINAPSVFFAPESKQTK